ncbi:MAG: L-glutamate gamma-semialdehyde dehydrogenase [Gaiellaceae bacterium]
MTNGIFRVPAAVNEPIRGYAPGSPERASLQARLSELSRERVEIPCVIGGKEVRTSTTTEVTMPHLRSHVLAELHHAGNPEVQQAIAAATVAAPDWSRTAWEDRAAIFLRAAELLGGPWRDTLSASTMLGQSKTAHQAEIDAACESIDFLRFNVEFMTRIYAEQPTSSAGVWNRTDYRPLEGFVFAVSPFNFTAIGLNLASAPALMGNTVVWKPAESAALSAYYTERLFRAAGLPDGVINVVHGHGPPIGEAALTSPDLAGIHFTGSTATFQHLWRDVGNRIDTFRTYPRLVGETGGKDFIVAHPSADVAALAAATVRGAFEYQGQKCSAASRMYVPSNLWPELRERLVAETETISMGDPSDFSNFMGAVIDEPALAKHRAALELARTSADTAIAVGGEIDDTDGLFVEPTIVETADPSFELLREEVFGPILTAYVYPENRSEETLDLVDATSPYGLTGAIFATEQVALSAGADALRNAAGNIYFNDKPTGAVVGQQPFGGSRASGTNDKAGSMWNLVRWVSPRTMKETFVPPDDYRYPFLGPDT